MSGFRLIVAEKPSVARDIARVLGITSRGQGVLGNGDTRVSWCLGHLVELAEPTAYDPEWKAWRFETLPMMPELFELTPRKSSLDQWKILRALLKHPELSGVINACDAGREGELIFANVYQAASCRASVRRLWISSMTDEAIREGFGSLREAEQMLDLEAAARCRSEADWLVGLNATRAMTLRARSGGGGALLSLGRVQTPTLALVAEREQQIESFVPEAFWQVFARFAAEDGDWEACWTKVTEGGRRIDRLGDKAAAQGILERIANQQGLVTRVEGKKVREKAPLLYDLTTLQKEANTRHGFSAQKTLNLAQSLYERHKVLTYPRTDSRHLSSDLVESLEARVRSLAFGPYESASASVLERWPVTLGRRVIDDAEVSDHHAIIPTGVDPRRRTLEDDEKKVFDLVARRFLAVFHPDAVFSIAIVDTTLGGELFAARGRVRLEAGWQLIDPPRSKRKDKELQLPSVHRGDTPALLSSRLHEGRTKAPNRYTEATLLGAMERAGEGLEDAELKRAMKRNGLGTPATRARIIETLLSRGYLRRDKKQLQPTPQGRALILALPVDALRSPKLTGEWEARLVAVAEGHDLRQAFMEDIRRFTAHTVSTLKSAEIEPELLGALAQETPADGPKLGDCPLCGKEVRESGRGWSCVGCPLAIPSSVARRPISPRMAAKLLKDGSTPPVKGFKSKAGKEFRAGLRFDESGKIVFHFPEAEALGDCPACGRPVRERGKIFTCDSGRECPFVVFGEMSGKTIAEPVVRELLEHSRSSILEGFKDRDEHPFSGRLEWQSGKVRVVRADPREELASPGPCPGCGKDVGFSRGRWRCSGCELSLPGTVAQRDLSPEEVAQLLSEGRTKRLHGFRQKSGTVFRATLVLDEERRVRIDYSSGAGEEGEPLPPGAPPPALGRRVHCPVCVQGASHEPGYVIAGREAWGCSRWKQGCTMRVPFVVEGQRLKDEDALSLFGRKHQTRYLKGLHNQRGQLPISRVVLVPAENPCWKLQPKGS